ncbi:MAG: DUF4199 domain-containing protein [Prevotella sp.]|jgi:hypothetical protein|nr:DUF4199 domain-containing protein [Prevotella sp.]MCI1282778.1 DUF4199 domain-containing protein [Prevotella sp.]
MSIFALDMIFSEALIQLKAFARQDGLILALVWLASFLTVLFIPKSTIGSLLAMATPFIVGWRLNRFRNYALGGYISFRRGLAYSLYTFFYASLLFCLAQYVYFRYLDHGLFTSILIMTEKVMTEAYQAQKLDPSDVQTVFGQLISFKPIQLSFFFMVQNLVLGLMMSPLIAILSWRRGPFQRKM